MGTKTKLLAPNYMGSMGDNSFRNTKMSLSSLTNTRKDTKRALVSTSIQKYTALGDLDGGSQKLKDSLRTSQNNQNGPSQETRDDTADIRELKVNMNISQDYSEYIQGGKGAGVTSLKLQGIQPSHAMLSQRTLSKNDSHTFVNDESLLKLQSVPSNQAGLAGGLTEDKYNSQTSFDTSRSNESPMKKNYSKVATAREIGGDGDDSLPFNFTSLMKTKFMARNSTKRVDELAESSLEISKDHDDDNSYVIL